MFRDICSHLSTCSHPALGTRLVATRGQRLCPDKLAIGLAHRESPSLPNAVLFLHFHVLCLSCIAALKCMQLRSCLSVMGRPKLTTGIVAMVSRTVAILKCSETPEPRPKEPGAKQVCLIWCHGIRNHIRNRMSWCSTESLTTYANLFVSGQVKADLGC